ncbi:MAG: trypsin-like peptidase domain-containing protein [Pirellulaceae bacterium]
MAKVTRFHSLLALSVTACFLSSPLVAQEARSPRASRPAVDPAVVRHADALSEAFRQASNVILPTVVKIKSRTEARRVVRRDPAMGELAPFRGLEDFFGEREFYQPPSSGTGSGVIIDPAGIVLTNNHVVNGADKVTIELQDGRTFEAEDIRTDPNTDLAVVRIKVPGGKLPFAQLGDSDALQVGDWVLAVGNPFEYQSSVSAGIISGKGRSIGAASRATFLQTDAAINPGNSGGPLVNLRGEVVGINTAIASKTGAFNGIGFAIPINLAKWVSQQLIEGGQVVRAWLGVGIRPLSPADARAMGLDDLTKGVLVSEVRYSAPADEAGLEPGDIVLSVADRSVDSSPTLQRLVEQAPLGSRQEMKILRNGRPLTLRVRTAALPDKETGAKIPNIRLPEGDIYEVAELGIRVYQINRSIADQLNLKSTENGMLVLGSNQLANTVGLERGSVIYKVNNTEIHDANDLTKALNESNSMRMFIEIPGFARRMIILSPDE